MLVNSGAILWLIGFGVALTALVMEFTTFKTALEEISELPKAEWQHVAMEKGSDLVHARVIANPSGPMILALELIGIAFIFGSLSGWVLPGKRICLKRWQDLLSHCMATKKKRKYPHGDEKPDGKYFQDLGSGYRISVAMTVSGPLTV
ncbi:MAG: hypothetical protein QHG99_08945 [Methanomicrobiales archaeon]|nr:hypothetical protein [Methanomicrobiales archaeon]